MDVIKEIFNKCQRFEVRSWKVRFNFENPNPGSVGSRFDFLEVRRFEVRNFPVRPNTSMFMYVLVTLHSLVYLFVMKRSRSCTRAPIGSQKSGCGAGRGMRR